MANNKRSCLTCSGTCKLNEKYGPDFSCGAWRAMPREVERPGEGDKGENKTKCPFLGALGECGILIDGKEKMCFEIESCTLRVRPGASR